MRRIFEPEPWPSASGPLRKCQSGTPDSFRSSSWILLGHRSRPSRARACGVPPTHRTPLLRAPPGLRRRRSARQENRTAREKGRQDLVAQTRVRGDQSPERITRNGEYFAGLGDPRRHEYTLTGQEIQLAEESAGRVAGDDAFLTLGVDDD